MAQHERVLEARERGDASPETPSVRCQVCGAEHRAEDPVLCRRCGEPVLVVGWAP